MAAENGSVCADFQGFVLSVTPAAVTVAFFTSFKALPMGSIF
jgi:hypothetical protein